MASRTDELRNEKAQGLHNEYDTLPTGGRYARYIILEPARADNDPLVCTLHTTQLDDFPAYEAVSYVWGRSVKDRSITVNKNWAVDITTNLYHTLVQVRSTDKARTLWVDSICINQADQEEKAYQVSFMDQIYRQSKCTLIFLGESANGQASKVADLVTDVDHMVQRVFEREDFSWEPNMFPLPDEGDPLISRDGWQWLGVLLQHPWFRRGWVVQEAALSRDAIVLWGNAEIEWLKLVQAYIWYTRRAMELPTAQFQLSELHLHGFYHHRHREAVTFRPRSATQPLTLLEVLDHARWLGVTDPRDRIYAFLSLANRNGHLQALQPNYEAPYMSAYHDFACEYMSVNNNLNILHFVHNDEDIINSESPSWIPRWDMHLYSNFAGGLNNYHRSSKPITSQIPSSPITVSLGQTILKLDAVIIDTVAFTAPGFNKDLTTPEDVASLWGAVSKRPGPTPYSCSPLRAFVNIFRCGVYRGRLKEWERLESAYMRLLEREISREDDSYKDAESFHQLRMEDVHNKSFFMSERRYYGLAPQTVREGDVCAIIFGTKSPFILRRTDHAGHYKLVGSTLILSKQLDHNGYPDNLGGAENCDDWTDFGLQQETISLC